MSDVDRAEQLAAAATPGPWFTESDGVAWCQVHAEAGWVAQTFGPTAVIDGADADAEFIAAARELVPALVARVRALTDAGNTLAAATYKFDDPAVDALVCAWRALVDDPAVPPENAVSPVQPREAGQPIPLSSDAPDGTDAHNGKGA